MMLRGASLGAVFLVGLLCADPGAADLPGPPQELLEETRGAFTLRYSPRRRVLLDGVFKHLMAERDRVSAELGAEAPPPVTVIMCETPGEFDDTVGYDAPWYVAGVARSDRRLIVLEMDVALGDLDDVLTHELCHIYLADALGARLDAVPLWMNEAIAKRISGDWTEADTIVMRDAVLGGKLLDFRDIERRFPAHHRSSSIAYAQSATLLEFAEQKAGPGVAPAYVDAIRQGQTHEEALALAAGMPLDQLEEEWLAYLREHYRGMLVLYRVDELIFSFMGLLLVVAVVVTVRRRRRWNRAREAEQEVNDAFGGSMWD